MLCSEILRSVSGKLQDEDEGARRWPWESASGAYSLMDSLNAAVREIVMQRPDATARTEPMRLEPGMMQRIPRADIHMTSRNAVSLINVIQNLAPDGNTPGRPVFRVELDALRAAMTPETILVSVMFVNNEIGSVQPIEEISKIVKMVNPQALLHVDAVQAWMRVPIKLDNIDTLSVSGHKIHAPKGIGALYLSDRLVQAFRPPYLGGEQERGLRPGTENLPYAMGLAAAATRLAKTMKSRDTAMKALNQRLREGLKAFPEVEINSPENAVPEVLNFSENCIKSETMLAWLAEAQIYVSSASACGRGQPSHTLAAMGKDPLAIDTAIRVSFCGDNTPDDVDAFLDRFEDGMKHLQKIRK